MMGLWQWTARPCGPRSTPTAHEREEPCSIIIIIAISKSQPDLSFSLRIYSSHQTTCHSQSHSLFLSLSLSFSLSQTLILSLFLSLSLILPPSVSLFIKLPFPHTQLKSLSPPLFPSRP